MKVRYITIALSIFAITVSGYFCDTNPEIESDTITLTWTVCEFDRTEPFYGYSCKRIPDVQVCVSEFTDIKCDKTDESGNFELQVVPMYAELLLTFSHPEYGRRLVPIQTGSRNVNWTEGPRNTALPAQTWYPPMTKIDTPGDPCSNSENTGDIAAIVLEFSFVGSYPLPINENLLLMKRIPGATVAIKGSKVGSSSLG